MVSYRVSSRQLGRSCDFRAEGQTREEVVKKAVEHAGTCSVCASLSEQQIASAVEELQ